MTDAAYKKSNKTDAVSARGQMRTTHPAYTEYSWSALANPETYRRAGTANQHMNRPKANVTSRPNANTSAGAAGGYRSQTNPRQPYAGKAPYQTAASVSAQRKISFGEDYINSGSGSKSAAAQHTRGAGAVGNAGTRAASAGKTAAKAKAKNRKIRTKSITTLHTIMSEKRYSFPLSIVLIALSLTILVLATITTSVKISEITTENSTLQKSYNKLVSDENELRMMLETRDDLRVVEEMAKNELGMVKKDQVQKYYLTVKREDKIELVEDKTETRESFIDGILSFGGSIVERIRAFFGL